MSDDQRHALRAGYGRDAECYQHTRPVLPDAMFDDLMRLAGLAPGDRLAEIGPGTGQATVPLAERGLAVTAVELDESLASVARSRLAAFPACRVVTSSFEDWEPTRTIRRGRRDQRAALGRPGRPLRQAGQAAAGRRRAGRGRLLLGAARGRRAVLERRAAGLPRGGLRRRSAATSRRHR